MDLEQPSLELQHIVLTDHALFLKAKDALRALVVQQWHVSVLGIYRWLGELPVHLLQIRRLEVPVCRLDLADAYQS